MAEDKKINRRNLPVVLAVDDEPAVLASLEAILENEFEVLTGRSGKEALEKINSREVDLVFLDIVMPDMDGMRVLRRIKECDDNLPVIMATASDSCRRAVEAMRAGAADYIVKPFDADEVVTVAKKALERKALVKEVACLRSQRENISFDNIVGKSRKIKEVFAIIEKVVKTSATVLISGESGTGKELIARAIHFNGDRKEKPFIPINCAGIPESLLESELFGHEKGSFTDAVCQKLGMFELAGDGTLFLDEVSGLKFEVQANLLRALEEREIRRLGGTRLIRIDARIIAATNVDLSHAVREGKFRQDLYYRLNVLPIQLAPLRERREDIPLLVGHFLERYNQIFRKEIKGLTPQALDYLCNYEWPGNVRELRNIIERLTALNDSGIITAKDIPFDIFVKGGFLKDFKADGALRQASRDFERQYIEAVLERVEGNQVMAAKVLGIHRNALFNKMKILGLKE